MIKLSPILLIKSLIVIITMAIGVCASAQTNKRIISLEWDPVDGATAYEVQFESVPDNSEEKSRKFGKVIESSEWNGLLPLGKYNFRVRSYDRRGVPGEWSENQLINVKIPTVRTIFPKNKSKIKSVEQEERSITFKWDQGKKEDTYILVITSRDDSVKHEIKVEGTEHTMNLPVAKAYTWRVEIDEETVLKEPPGSGSIFAIFGGRLPSPVINEPEADEDIENLSWDEVKNAESYSYYIAIQNEDKKWKILAKKKKSPDLEVAIPPNYPDGNYKLVVKAHGRLRPSSNNSSYNFSLNRQRELAAVETKETLSYEPTWFGHANYYITNMLYSNQESEGQTKNIPAVGGTGELGISYTKTNQPWGFQLMGNLGGFLTNGEINNFFAVEMGLNYSNWTANKKSLEHSFGIYHKTYPHIWATNTGDNVREEVSQLGLYYGIKYWRKFTGNYGLSASARLYLGSDVGTTPEGGGPNDSNSFKASLMGSYQMSESMLGYMGLTYYNEEVLWDSATSDPNSINILGTYLSFELDYKF